MKITIFADLISYSLPSPQPAYGITLLLKEELKSAGAEGCERVRTAMLKSLLDRLIVWHEWDVHLPFFSSSGRPEAQPFGARVFFRLVKIQIARNCGTSFIRLQSTCTPSLPLHSEFRHLQPPSAFRDHAPILFSNT